MPLVRDDMTPDMYIRPAPPMLGPFAEPIGRAPRVYIGSRDPALATGAAPDDGPQEGDIWFAGPGRIPWWRRAWARLCNRWRAYWMGRRLARIIRRHRRTASSGQTERSADDGATPII